MTSWQAALLGGSLIGVAAIIMMGMLGRITGISGILSTAIGATKNSLAEASWRWFFLAGLVVGTFLYHLLSGQPVPEPPDDGVVLAIIAGLLVGFGTRLGSGCTSGHGICGISRFSGRSLIATALFCGAGIIALAIKNMIL